MSLDSFIHSYVAVAGVLLAVWLIGLFVLGIFWPMQRLKSKRGKT